MGKFNYLLTLNMLSDVYKYSTSMPVSIKTRRLENPSMINCVIAKVSSSFISISTYIHYIYIIFAYKHYTHTHITHIYTYTRHIHTHITQVCTSSIINELKKEKKKRIMIGVQYHHNRIFD